MIREIFKAKGQLTTLHSNDVLEREAGMVCFVEKGHLAAFLCTLRPDGSEGIRHLICEFSTSSLLFPLPKKAEDHEYEIKVVALEPSVLWKMPIEALQPESSEDFYRCLEQLVGPLKRDLESQQPHSLDRVLTAGESITVEKGEFAGYVQKQISWLSVSKGNLHLLGHPETSLREGEAFPLVERLWFQAEETSQVIAFSTRELVEKSLWASAIERFLIFLVDFHVFRFRKFEKEELIRLHEKEKEEAEHLRETLKGMLAIFYQSKFLKITTAALPVFKACQLLGEYQEISFVQPEGLSQEKEIQKQLSLIGAASKVRYRPVKLEKKWWKNDCGHLLAFMNEELKPVVLINRSHGNYQLIDPESMQIRKFDEETSAMLSKQAFQFYQPIPESIQSGWDMARFYIRQASGDIVAFVIYSVIVAVISLFTPFAAWALFNAIIPLVETPLLLQIGLGLVASGIGMAFFYFFKSLMLVRMKGKIFNRFQLGIWDRFLKLPASFSRRYRTGNLFMRILAVTQIQDALNDNVLRTLFSGIFALFYTVMMVIYSPALTLNISFVLAAFVAFTVFCYRYAVKKEELVQESTLTISGFLVQIINGVSKLRIAGAERHAFSHWAKDFIQQKKYENQIQHSYAISAIAMAIFPISSFLILFALVMYAFPDVDTQKFLGFNVAFSMLIASTVDFSSGLFQQTKLKPLWKRVNVILAEPIEDLIDRQKPGNLVGEVSVEAVDFRYAPDTPLILQNVTVTAYPGEFIGIIGSSGSGKSTLFRLILGFEKPEKGSVSYDRKDISALDMHDVRKQLGVVLQEGGITEGSLYDNLTCGGLYTPELIKVALERSGFDEEMGKFPMGLHTYIPVNGATLSGGQRQRLLLARALLSQPRILLMDEATSALDNRTQEKISSKIAELDLTRIAIAHRLSTIKNADRIYVLDRGQVADVGTFDELASRPGLFQRMLERQKL